MSAEKKSVASLFNLCHLLMTELGMPEMAVREFLHRASTASGLESLESVRFWKFLVQPLQVLQEKLAMGPFEPAWEVTHCPIPDLNQPASENEEPWELNLELKLCSGKAFGIIQDGAPVVEADHGNTTGGKRKMAQANYSLLKKTKFTKENVGPSNNEKGKGVFERESCGSNSMSEE